jgi:hypothetical protein
MNILGDTCWDHDIETKLRTSYSRLVIGWYIEYRINMPQATYTWNNRSSKGNSFVHK